MTESIKHLEEAIAHAKQDHADVATKHTIEALKHMRHSAAQSKNCKIKKRITMNYPLFLLGYLIACYDCLGKYSIGSTGLPCLRISKCN